MLIFKNLQEQLEQEKRLRIETMAELTNVKESYKRLEIELKHKVNNKSVDEEMQSRRQLSKFIHSY
jgi:hypothetical protein